MEKHDILLYILCHTIGAHKNIRYFRNSYTGKVIPCIALVTSNPLFCSIREVLIRSMTNPTLTVTLLCDFSIRNSSFLSFLFPCLSSFNSTFLSILANSLQVFKPNFHLTNRKHHFLAEFTVHLF